MTERINQNPMGSRPVLPLLVSMSLPPILSMLIQSLYNVVDSIFVARLSSDALTAVSLAYPLQNLVLALLNQQYDSQGLVFRHVSSLRLETEEELPWSLDGEYAPSVPVVDIVNRQRALRMLL